MTEDTFSTEDRGRITESSATEGQVVMPFYIICDVSGSMSKDMEDLNSSVRDLLNQIQKDPVVDDLVMLSLITFNHAARPVIPLSTPSDITPPVLTASGGTTYSEAFRVFQQAFETDRKKLKAQGRKVFRPCVFFLTDGAPGDHDYLKVFQELLGYDPDNKRGNVAYPYFVPVGFRDAPLHVIKTLAYPNFGKTKGRWFLCRDQSVSTILSAIADMLGNTVVSSGQSAASGEPQLVPPTPPPGSNMQFGEGNFV